jgi:predicted nucleic acid-binding protein
MSMLLDSNIIIYAARPEHSALRDFIAEHAPAISVVSYIEVVGYHKLSEADKEYFQEFFDAALVLPISDAVVEKAVELRQAKKMSLGDSIIAATALTHDLQLVTRNIEDFRWIDDLLVVNPFDSMETT